MPVRTQSLGLADTAGGVFLLKGGAPPPRFRPPPPPDERGGDRRLWAGGGRASGGRLAEYVETSSDGEDVLDPPPLDYRYVQIKEEK